MSARSIIEVAGVECGMVSAEWQFEVAQSEAIDRHWRARVAQTPDLFNGRVLLLRHGAVETDEAGRAIFRGACFETNFKAFMAWREFGFPPTEIRNIFSMAAIETADGAFVLGEMAPHTAPAGQIYFPSGTPDRSDVKAGRVDIDGSAVRELQEETGLIPDDVELVSGMDLVLDPVRVCCMKRVRSRETAADLVERIHAWLAQDSKPELTRMHTVRDMRDIRPTMPDFVVSYLTYRLDRR